MLSLFHFTVGVGLPEALKKIREISAKIILKTIGCMKHVANVGFFFVDSLPTTQRHIRAFTHNYITRAERVVNVRRHYYRMHASDIDCCFYRSHGKSGKKTKKNVLVNEQQGKKVDFMALHEFSCDIFIRVIHCEI